MSRFSQTGGNTEPMPFVRRWGPGTEAEDDNGEPQDMKPAKFEPLYEDADNYEQGLKSQISRYITIVIFQETNRGRAKKTVHRSDHAHRTARNERRDPEVERASTENVTRVQEADPENINGDPEKVRDFCFLNI